MKADKINIGILAHVDAGKTTLAEGLLYYSGKIKKVGRVDHKDAFLDTDDLEKARGITIFSKQAELEFEDMSITLMDTPGHVDFSTEMERTLRVLDYAILVVSGADGVQGHVQTLWRLLELYEVPTFIFVNKMDQPVVDREQLLKELQKRLNEHCVVFDESAGREDRDEWIAMSDEVCLDSFLEEGELSDVQIREAILGRKIFPCYFGSALKLEGVTTLIDGLRMYTEYKEYADEFGAQVFKISRDPQGGRLTYLKVTGGTLRVKAPLTNQHDELDDTQRIWEEKVDQIRVYSGTGYEAVQEVKAGTICAVTGLNYTKSGEGLGVEKDWELPVLEPILTYQIILPEEVNVYDMFLKLHELEEEEPALHIIWDKQSNEIQAQVMGEVQIEILQSMIEIRYGVQVEFGSESIVYKETIQNKVIGIGHFEPLRHYAEAHIMMEPLPCGSGIEIDTICSEDELERNWQRLVMAHIRERAHRGVLTGSEITDIKFTLVAGRAHLKHTEGGDFRQATYRAIRQGLMQAESQLLEPMYEFRLEVPSENTGRALNDIQVMCGTFDDPEMDSEMTVITGKAPVSTMRGYQRDVISYTKGYGKLAITVGGYGPCHNQEQIVKASVYDPKLDIEHPTDSVFCAHGAGYSVPWDEVKKNAHLDSSDYLKNKSLLHESAMPREVSGRNTEEMWISQDEIDEIFARTYKNSDKEPRKYRKAVKTVSANPGGYRSTSKPKVNKEKYLLVDGYNIVFAWDELKELAKVNIEGARGKLLDDLCNYQGYKKEHVIVVFDGYKVKGNIGTVQQYHNIQVIYTKEAETADAYIEKTVHKMAKDYDVTVATSDGLEQMIIMGQGAMRMSANGLLEEITAMKKEIRADYLEQMNTDKNRLLKEQIEKLQQEEE